ncbi:hypothetical protein QBC38DRAFT_481122 [Podospora fimiseda]|uniref:Uncharacterized protein n=1 Tax=Podospora fimiseda TaxID=252190 RepID=A0AAN7BMS2_9PEZI|nr:hypothetical protein QBC38DRAFT_481122 [Podospora fimiseda]
MAPHFPWSKSKDDARKGKDSATPAQAATLLLDEEDEQFLERLVSRTADEQDDGPRPALPPRSKTPDLNLIWDEETETFHAFDNLEDPFAKALVLADTTNTNNPAADSSSTPTDIVDKDAKDKEKEMEKKPSRLSRMFHRDTKEKEKETSKKSTNNNLEVPSSSSSTPEKEWADLSRLLDKLTPSPSSSESKTQILTREARDQVLTPFLQILKDLANGVPTAADDLKSLLDGRSDIISKSFSKLPSSLQKLVTQLPDKLTSKLAPEILALAAEAQGIDKERLAKKGMKGLMPTSLSEMALTPALIKSMLKAIVNALKTRWPAFAGASALWSVAVVLLLFVLWYCHKRGREEREKKEQEAAAAAGKEGEEGEQVKGTEVVDAIVEADAAKNEAKEGEASRGDELVVVVAPQASDEGKK